MDQGLQLLRDFMAAVLLLSMVFVGMLFSFVKLIWRPDTAPSPLATVTARTLRDIPSFILALLTASVVLLLAGKTESPRELWAGWFLFAGYFTGARSSLRADSDVLADRDEGASPAEPRA